MKKTVPLVIYDEHGNRKVVGDAEVCYDENGIVSETDVHVSGNVTDPAFGLFLMSDSMKGLSLGIPTEDPPPERRNVFGNLPKKEV